jgi:hypothetical protein
MAKLIGKGTKLFVENVVTPGQWDSICFTELTEPEGEWGEVETTDSCTTGKVKEFTSGLLDNGTFSFVGHYDNEAADKAIAASLQTSFDAGTTRNFRIDATQLSTGERKEFTGFLKKFSKPNYAGSEEMLQISGEIRISGAIVPSDIS